MEVKTVMRIFDEARVRTTAIHEPDPQKWVKGFGISRLAFGISNNLDADIIVQPIGRVGSAQGNLGSPITVPASGEGVIPINLYAYWAPFISVTIQPVSTPTKGAVTVYAVWEE